eukprot:s367_g35.t1
MTNASDEWSFISDPTQVTYKFEHANSFAQFAANVLRDDEMPLHSVPPPNEEEDQALQQLSPQQRKALAYEIDKAHKGMGHPHHSRFLRILKLGGASNATMALAKMYECSQCRENARPKPWRRAAPPRELKFNEVVGIDTFTLKHFDHSIKCLNVICWGTRYQMVIPLQGEKASDARAAYRQWTKLFGPPKVLKPDLGTEFLRDFLYRCSTDGTEVDPSSLESPTQNSITEREGGSFKTMFNKASLDYGRTDDVGEIQELLETVVMCKNRLTHRGGYSAIHRVFGYTPSMPGDVLFSREQEDNLQHHDMLELGDVTLQRQQKMRECAGRAFFSAECAAAIRRAVSSGPRTTENFEVGQLVYFWSRGQFNKVGVHHSATRRPNHAFWNGPCRVIATQYPTSIYIAFQGRLIKAAPEQCRRVSEDEDATCSDVLKRLCNVRDTIRDGKISGISDIRGEPYPDFDHPTGRKRNYGKQPPVVRQKFPRMEMPAAEPTDDVSEGYPSPSIMDDSDVETTAMESDQELLLEIEFGDNHVDSWYNAIGTVPQDVNKKAAKELKLKDLDPHDAELFKNAIDKEWQTNIANGAIKVLDPIESQRIRQKMPQRVMQSRLLHVAKPLDDPSQVESNQILNCSPAGTFCKAKSRWIARGDKDPDLFSVCASSPVIHRDTFMLGLQILASKNWRMHFADFSQAFMQGDGLQREQPLFCEPPVKDLPGVQHGSSIQICKTVYGLVDAPYRWNQHMDQLFKSMGYKPSLLDACCYMLHSEDHTTLEGIIMVATDDLISGGNSRHQALMNEMKQKYKFGKWEHDVGRFCGKDLKQHKDFSITVSQQYYTETKFQERIHIPKGLANDTPCTVDQIKTLREKVGALSWLSKETRIDLCGSVSLLMQSFPNPTVGDLKTCNRILKEANMYKDLEVRIRPIKPEDVCIVVSSDAAWANAKDEDGAHKSQAGYVVLAADRNMLKGDEAPFSMIGWKSHTLKRRTVSTLSAETQGIVESAAVACWYRYLLAEFFYKSLVRQDGIDWETMIEPLEFGLVTDAKSVDDALTCPTGSGSADKRTTIDLAIIREYLRRHNGCIRWIDGSVQLADSLTKFMTADFLRSVMQRGSYQLRAEYETLELKQRARMEKDQRKKEQLPKQPKAKSTESVTSVDQAAKQLQGGEAEAEAEIDAGEAEEQAEKAEAVEEAAPEAVPETSEGKEGSADGPEKLLEMAPHGKPTTMMTAQQVREAMQKMENLEEVRSHVLCVLGIIDSCNEATLTVRHGEALREVDLLVPDPEQLRQTVSAAQSFEELRSSQGYLSAMSLLKTLMKTYPHKKGKTEKEAPSAEESGSSRSPPSKRLKTQVKADLEAASSEVQPATEESAAANEVPAEVEEVAEEQKSTVSFCPDCKEQMEKRKVRKHKLKDCPMRYVECPDCKDRMRWRNLEEHQKSECDGRPVQCEVCKGTTTYGKRQVHKDHECPEREVLCPNAADEKIRCLWTGRAKDLEKHMEQCKSKADFEKMTARFASAAKPSPSTTAPKPKPLAPTPVVPPRQPKAKPAPAPAPAKAAPAPTKPSTWPLQQEEEAKAFAAKWGLEWCLVKVKLEGLSPPQRELIMERFQCPAGHVPGGKFVKYVDSCMENGWKYVQSYSEWLADREDKLRAKTLAEERVAENKAKAAAKVAPSRPEASITPSKSFKAALAAPAAPAPARAREAPLVEKWESLAEAERSDVSSKKAPPPGPPGPGPTPVPKVTWAKISGDGGEL